MPEKHLPPLDPIITEKINHMERFEKGPPPPKEKFETKQEKQEREMREKLKANLIKNREEAKNCKYPVSIAALKGLLLIQKAQSSIAR